MAGEVKFTPGPWHVTERLDLFRIRETASDAVLATTDNGGHPTEELIDFDQQCANAALIAAAPDLYEALQLMVSNFAGLLNDGDHDKVYAALAKARGEPS